MGAIHGFFVRECPPVSEVDFLFTRRGSAVRARHRPPFNQRVSVIVEASTAPRAHPLLASMAFMKPFPIADESGAASAATPITVIAAAGEDRPRCWRVRAIQIETAYQPVISRPGGRLAAGERLRGKHRMIVCRVSVALLASTALAFWQMCAGAQEIAAPFSPPSIPLPSLRLGSEGTVYAPFGKGSIPIRHAADEYSVLDFGAKCDGLTNDTAAIQAAMNAAAVVKVSLTIAPRNATCRANDLYYKTGVRLGIDGTLKSFGNSTTPLSNYSSAFGGPIESDVVIEGDGVIDNQMTARGVAHPVACIYSHGPVQDFTLRGVTLKGCGNSPVNIVGGSNTPGAGAAHVYLSYVKILGTGNNNANQFAEGCDDCWVDHIRIDNLTNDFLWAFYGNVTNSGITNSYINGHGNPGTMGIGVLSDAGQPAPSSNILIEGNEITGVDGCAVWVQGTSTATSGQSLKQKNIRIIGNDGHGNNTGRHPNWGGECILDGSTIASASNIWHDDGVANANGSTNKTPTAGIYFYPATSTSQAVDHYTSLGDTIFNEGVNGTGNRRRDRRPRS